MGREYPAQYSKTSRLNDGTEIFLRPIKPTDDSLLVEMFNGLSKKTIQLRFFSTLKYMPKEQLERFTRVDYEKQMAIVALVREGEREWMVAVGRYTLDEKEEGAAEFAIVVQDAYQGRGIGTEVLWHLAHVAKLQNVRVIIGYIMDENTRMFAVLKRSGLTMTRRHWDRGITRVDIPIDENVQIQ
ncbi:MAG: N-acetyltransferase [Candidatus Abyssobacteria bacterium SURF_17]|uniref:N-acetyltransferase n=1 Tax=Candidatus Abyssobacteria bacterium SURF_17 TaxID=2093361 RepID=A0A419F9U6_9BACT|nr:MAG: N-acetyltransferase [Candidatus Abyssubacteria bacterium SURF_17]